VQNIPPFSVPTENSKQVCKYVQGTVHLNILAVIEKQGRRRGSDLPNSEIGGTKGAKELRMRPLSQEAGDLLSATGAKIY